MSAIASILITDEKTGSTDMLDAIFRRHGRRGGARDIVL
jgi:hypothetical protein